MPIDFVIMRASSIPFIVKTEGSLPKVGITGSDILWEATEEIDTGEEMPLYELNPNAKRASLYVGMTKNFADYVRSEKSRQPAISDLTGAMVATKYPRIANGILRGYGVRTPMIFPIPGTDEAVQYAFPNCLGLVGTIGSGKTTKANDIEILDVFYNVSVRMMQAAEKLNARDVGILDDFREQVYVAMQRRRMI